MGKCYLYLQICILVPDVPLDVIGDVPAEVTLALESVEEGFNVVEPPSVDEGLVELVSELAVEEMVLPPPSVVEPSLAGAEVVVPAAVESMLGVEVTVVEEGTTVAGSSRVPLTIPGVHVTRNVPFHSTLASRLRSAKKAPKPDSGEASFTVSH